MVPVKLAASVRRPCHVAPPKVRFAVDSPLEGDGFELPVPIAAGHAFAREARRACHIVEAEESSPREFEIGPAFCDIANVPGMTAAALRVFLTSSHPKMPNLALTPEETRM